MENIQTQIPKRNLPRDVFLHLLAIVTLYWSSITFVTLLWQFINNFLPDVLTDAYMYQAKFELMRFAVSSLFIVFPLFIFVSWFLNKIYKREAVVRESKIRKWLLYFTLFVAALVVVGDLVSVINNLLSGETTFRFILKALSVLLVAGFVFGYYLDDVRRDVPSKYGKHFAYATGLLVLIAIIGSFFVIGSPTTARLMQFDLQKVSDLSSIQYQILNYWQSKEKLPEKLSDLTDSISGFKAPINPQTNSQYEYIVIDAVNLKFQLCADFNKPSERNQPKSLIYYPGQMSENWDHLEGRFCFERQIDKQLYPINKNIIK
jgi:hypothetical protein